MIFVAKLNVYCVGLLLWLIILHCVKFILVKISDLRWLNLRVRFNFLITLIKRLFCFAILKSKIVTTH